jgi:long-subunit fatty acid transport protein
VRAFAGLLLSLFLLQLAPRVVANPEASFLSDGRSVAMGGVGVATNDYAASVWQNPAGLSEVQKLSVTGALLPLVTRLDRPFPDPSTGSPVKREGTWRFGSLATLAAGYRVHERVAVGVATYIFSGTSVRIDDAVAGEDVSASSFAGELQIPVSITVTPALSLAASWRVTFARTTSSIPVPTEPPPPGLARAETRLSGWDAAGFAFGARYRFNEMFRMGLTYRTKVVVDLDGSTRVTSVDETLRMGTRGDYPLPHTFRLGSELRLLSHQLVLAADLSLWLFRESHPRDPPSGRAEAWRNAARLNLGGEYWVREQVSVRVGFYIGNSATSEGAATQLGISPNPAYALSAGAGVKLRDAMDLDFALAYSSSVRRSVSAAVNPNAAGPYGGHAVFFAASLHYGI